MPGRDDTHANYATRVYMVLLDVGSAAGEGGGAVQDEVEDDGGGSIVGGEEDRGNADGNGHGHGHGHGQPGHNDATSIGGG
jgi:hypothetical protein